MKLKIPNCPECGAPAACTIDSLLASAYLSDPDEDGEFDYVGQHKIHWDTQEAIKNALDEIQVECGSYEKHQWWTAVEEG